MVVLHFYYYLSNIIVPLYNLILIFLSKSIELGITILRLDIDRYQVLECPLLYCVVFCLPTSLSKSQNFAIKCILVLISLHRIVEVVKFRLLHICLVQWMLKTICSKHFCKSFRYPFTNLLVYHTPTRSL